MKQAPIPLGVRIACYWPAWVMFCAAMLAFTQWMYFSFGQEPYLQSMCAFLVFLLVHVLLLSRGDKRLDDWKRLTGAL